MENALIFKQILPNNSVRKCIEISLENLYSWILGLKEFLGGLSCLLFGGVG